MSERIQARAAASLLGVTARTVQNLAARGELPSAAKIGKVWTFDAYKLARHVAAKEAEAVSCQKQTFTKGPAFGGSGQPLPASKSESRYAQAMSKLLGGCATRG
jgi:hypothetical protein